MILFYFNIVFMLKWTYLFMHSWGIKNQNFKRFLEIYAILICKKKFKLIVMEQQKVDSVSTEHKDLKANGVKKKIPKNKERELFKHHKIIKSIIKKQVHPKLNDIDRPKHEDDPFFDGSDTSKNLNSMDKMMNDSAPLKMDKMNIDSVPQKFEKGYDKFLVKYAKYNKKGNPKQHPRLHGIVEHPDEGVNNSRVLYGSKTDLNVIKHDFYH